ncbi:hypothetical protein B0H16DRAFT_1785872 [Mycena metata]|uniref:Uncharacterized protein n=1 Tax=Mycena metata TaxID=1033252 RepID=A0AAD7MMK2_9AGAR|nr:hypothetical protein B0H16DRAFT_1785872 [Mycena metata]
MLNHSIRPGIISVIYVLATFRAKHKVCPEQRITSFKRWLDIFIISRFTGINWRTGEGTYAEGRSRRRLPRWGVYSKLGSASPAACLCAFKLQRHALVPASKKTQSGRVFAKFYQATTFSILTPLAAAVCAESDNQQDMEPEDSEPYLNTSDLDATIATTDTEAAGPTLPLPPKNKKCSGGPLPPPSSLRTLKRPHRTATTSTIAAKGSGRWWLSLLGMWHTLLHISSTRWGDGIQGWPLVDANGHIFAMLAEDPLTAHLHWLHTDPVGWNVGADLRPPTSRPLTSSQPGPAPCRHERAYLCRARRWWTREGVGGHGGFLPMFKYDEIAKALTHFIVIEDTLTPTIRPQTCLGQRFKCI